MSEMPMVPPPRWQPEDDRLKQSTTKVAAPRAHGWRQEEVSPYKTSCVVPSPHGLSPLTRRPHSPTSLSAGEKRNVKEFPSRPGPLFNNERALCAAGLYNLRGGQWPPLRWFFLCHAAHTPPHRLSAKGAWRMNEMKRLLRPDRVRSG